ncbi:MAG: hypothetical protein ACOCVA_07110 [Prolixibacteraceae bacterium]
MKTIQFNTKQILLAAFFILFILGSANAKGTETIIASGLEDIAEPELEVESWMVNENYWNATGKTVQLFEDSDAKLEIESWMTDDNYWVLQPVIRQTGEDEKLQVENWMISEQNWQ